jgi:hypothetical protein
MEVRDPEHVRCTLKLNLQNHDAPREDTRVKIFKPHAWCGPELYVSVERNRSRQLTVETGRFASRNRTVSHQKLFPTQAPAGPPHRGAF